MVEVIWLMDGIFCSKKKFNSLFFVICFWSARRAGTQGASDCGISATLEAKGFFKRVLSILNCCCREHLFAKNGFETRWRSNNKSNKSVAESEARKERNSNNNIIIKHTKGWTYSLPFLWTSSLWMSLRQDHLQQNQLYCESISGTIALRSAKELIWWPILRQFVFMTLFLKFFREIFACFWDFYGNLKF